MVRAHGVHRVAPAGTGAVPEMARATWCRRRTTPGLVLRRRRSSDQSAVAVLIAGTPAGNGQRSGARVHGTASSRESGASRWLTRLLAFGCSSASESRSRLAAPAPRRAAGCARRSPRSRLTRPDIFVLPVAVAVQSHRLTASTKLSCSGNRCPAELAAMRCSIHASAVRMPSQKLSLEHVLAGPRPSGAARRTGWTTG